MLKLQLPTLVHLSVLLLAGSATAQNTWIVDAQNRPGTNFTDLIQAVGSPAVLPGDTLLIRPPSSGGYPAPAITKGLTLIRENWGVYVPFSGTLTIRGIPAGQRCVVKGFSGGIQPTDAILVEDCAGEIHLENVGVGLPVVGTMNSITVRRCQNVTMTECGATAMIVEDSTVLLNKGGILASPGPQPWAMSATNSKVILSDAYVAGSAGQGDPFLCTVTRQPGAAAQLNNSHLLLSGPSGDLFGAAVYYAFCGTLAAAPAAFGTGTITYDPRSTGVHGPVQGNIQLIVHPVPNLSARFPSPGGNLYVSFWGDPNAPVAILASPPVAAPLFNCPYFCRGTQGWPGLWIDPSAFFSLALGTTNSVFSFNLTVPIPNPNTFPITPLALQSVVLTSQGLVDLSTGAVVVIGPQGTLPPP